MGQGNAFETMRIVYAGKLLLRFPAPERLEASPRRLCVQSESIARSAREADDRPITIVIVFANALGNRVRQTIWQLSEMLMPQLARVDRLSRLVAGFSV